MLGGIGLWDAAFGKARPAGDPNRYMFFATGNRWNSGFGMAAPANLNYMASRLKFGSGPYQTNDFLLHFSGFALTEGGNSPQETVVPGNDIVVDEVYVRVEGVDYPVSFAGSPGVTIASATLGAWGAVTLPASLPALSDFEVITCWHVAASANYIGAYRIQKHRNEKVWQAADLTAVKALMSTDSANAAMYDSAYNNAATYPTGQALAYGPDMMVAKGWDGRPVALCPCDSFGEARQEVAATADTRRNMGWMRRWLDRDDPTYGRIPHFMMGVPGTKAQLDLTGSGSTIATRRWDVMDEIKTLNGGLNPWTVVFGESGRNDNNATATTWRNHIRSFVDRIEARYPGCRIVWATMPATVTTTDRYVTVANQSVATLWGATLQAVNDDIETLMAGKIDAFMDYWAYASHDATGKWRPAEAVGVLTAQAGTDGVATYNTFTSSVPLVPGQQYAFGATGGTVTAVSGSGPYTITRQENAAAVVAAGTTIYEQSTPDGVHPNLGYILDTVALIPASEKAKLT